MNILFDKLSKQIPLLAIMLVAFFSSSIVLNNSDYRFFYQSYFEPATHIACDHGFIATELNSNQALNEFLEQKRGKITCDEISTANLTSDTQYKPWYYMMTTTGLIWKYLGISWKNVDILSAFLFSLTITFSFGLFRLGANKWVAFICALLFCFSTQHSRYLFYLRDYSIAPFMIASLFFIGLVISKPLSLTYQIACFVALGITIGVGYGFRPDILILLPYAIISILFFLPDYLYKNIRNRLLFLLVFIVSFIITAWPMLQNSIHSEVGSGTFHFLLLGLESSFSKELHILNQIHYDVIYKFDDMLAYEMTIANGYHLNGTFPNYIDKLYDFASFDIYKNYILTFPFDFALRGWSSIIGILSTTPIVDIENHTKHFPACGLFATFIAAILLLFYQPKIGLFYILSILYLLAYPALVYDERHFFYLYVAYWWPIGFITSSMYSITFNSQYREDIIARFRKNWKISFASGGLLILFSFVIMLPLYFMQNQSFARLIQSYIDAPTRKLNVTFTQDKNTTTYLLNQQEIMKPIPFRQSNLDISRHDFTVSKMLKITLNLDQCHVNTGPLSLDLNYNYPLNNTTFDFSRQIEIDQKYRDKDVYVFIPIYMLKENNDILIDRYFYPTSLSLPSNYQNCLKELAYISNADFHPLWISIIVPENWNSSMLHSTINWRK